MTDNNSTDLLLGPKKVASDNLESKLVATALFWLVSL